MYAYGGGSSQHRIYYIYSDHLYVHNIELLNDIGLF